MILKEEVRESCGECHRFKRTISEASYGCDGCKRPIDEQLNNPDSHHRHYLEITVHTAEHNSSDRFQFCSWKCLLKKLPKIKCDYFINLPFVTFDNSLEKGIRAKDFFAAIRKGVK